MTESRPRYLLCRWVLDFLWQQELPVIIQRARLLLSAVDRDGVGVVRLDNPGVHVRELITFSGSFWLLEDVLALVCDDSVGSFRRTTDVRTKH